MFLSAKSHHVNPPSQILFAETDCNPNTLVPVPVGYTSVKTLSLVLAGAMSSKKHQAPVEPKPSAERSVASRSSTSCTDAQAIRSSTS